MHAVKADPNLFAMFIEHCSTGSYAFLLLEEFLAYFPVSE